jgi:hypothetical protein
MCLCVFDLVSFGERCSLAVFLGRFGLCGLRFKSNVLSALNGEVV